MTICAGIDIMGHLQAEHFLALYGLQDPNQLKSKEKRLFPASGLNLA